MLEKYRSNPDLYKKFQEQASQLHTYEGRFKFIKQNFIGASQILQNKLASKNESEIEKWRSKAEKYYLELTEFLAKDWGYDVETFRELCSIRRPNLLESNIKSSVYLEIGLAGGDVDFFDLYATKPQKQSQTESKSIWQKIIDYFS